MKTRRFLVVVMLLFASTTPVWANDQAAFYDSIKNRAAQGEASAQSALGFMYFKGEGVPQDYVQAHKWLNLAAADSPTGYVAEMRDYVAADMTPVQITEAQKLAREWKKK